MLETTLQVAQGHMQLQRFPVEKGEKLRAWDAADEYLLNDVAAKLALFENPRVLLINDSFGALAVALHAVQPCSVSDSFISQQATVANLALNALPVDAVQLFNSLRLPAGEFDFILIKVPKTLAYLEDILIRLQSALKPDTQLIVAGMVKNLPASVWQTVERLVGRTVPSKAVKKARLIYATPDEQRCIPANPYPLTYQLENTDYQICNHANVFSHKNLDIGTRYFLANLPQHNKYRQVVDLGCGNGLVGLIFAANNPAAQLHFIDESFMAVASAQQNFEHAFKTRKATFTAADALTDFAPDSIDLVLCNPPFHQQTTIGSHIAMRMFNQAKKVLRTGGELWVIGNRHLGYQASLKKYFSSVELVASNAKFIIVKASN
ncbi:50S rRNA methyltransferase [Methyloprofundus sedimenti]|uniref:Ribosomal RNA large subunit methyltransferase G n=1 Tax=Methyloprofundus sedimenti TaxID=1420851 RepID=A0A1V8MAH0_9GAMM|nr:methyltransferase [Methyloprofundus sedimenti]OQK18508.1 50S rRNA methyltransferase [Methyloprofundus sedimenti]